MRAISNEVWQVHSRRLTQSVSFAHTHAIVESFLSIYFSFFFLVDMFLCRFVARQFFPLSVPVLSVGQATVRQTLFKIDKFSQNTVVMPSPLLTGGPFSAWMKLISHVCFFDCIKKLNYRWWNWTSVQWGTRFNVPRLLTHPLVGERMRWRRGQVTRVLDGLWKQFEQKVGTGW